MMKGCEKMETMPRVISMWEHCGWGNSIYFINNLK